MNKIEKGATVLVILFVVVRFVPVASTLGQYGVNAWIFLTLDIATTPPYVKGMSMLVRNINGKSPIAPSVGWGSVAAVSFLAPYLYLYWAGGKEFPIAVSIGIGIIILLLGTISVVKFLREVKKAP